MNRRSFLGGILSVGGLAALPAVTWFAPVLYGDGSHDDSDALEALMNGRPVTVDGVLIKPSETIFRGGVYTLRRMITVDTDAWIDIESIHLIAEHNDQFAIFFRRVGRLAMKQLMIDRKPMTAQIGGVVVSSHPAEIRSVFVGA